jgi:hypothetical protein
MPNASITLNILNYSPFSPAIGLHIKANGLFEANLPVCGCPTHEDIRCQCSTAAFEKECTACMWNLVLLAFLRKSHRVTDTRAEPRCSVVDTWSSAGPNTRSVKERRWLACCATIACSEGYAMLSVQQCVIHKTMHWRWLCLQKHVQKYSFLLVCQHRLRKEFLSSLLTSVTVCLHFRRLKSICARTPYTHTRAHARARTHTHIHI